MIEFHCSFNNLHDLSKGISKEEWKNIWIPNFVLHNTANKATTSTSEISYGVVELKLMNKEEFYPEISNDHYKNFVHKGKNVDIYKRNYYTNDFICHFNWAYYPFDSQKCTLEFSLVNALFDQIILNITTGSAVKDYSTLHLQLLNNSICRSLSGHQMSIVHLRLERNFLPLLMNTYLPTFILTVINQLTNYFIGYEMFEGIIATNSTVLMTLASLFISAFNSMPKTTYIKMIDVWMIVTFVYPFIIIFVHTVLHVLAKKNMKGGTRQSKAFWCLHFFSQIVLPSLFLLFTVTYWFVGLRHWMSTRIWKVGLKNSRKL